MKILRNTAQWVETRQVFTEPNKRDPLTLDVIFPHGHSQYIDFFCTLTARWASTAPQPAPSGYDG